MDGEKHYSSDSDSDDLYEMGNSDPKYENILENIVIRLTRALVPEEYGNIEYWKERYESNLNDEYEWFQSWENIYPFIKNFIHPNRNALNIGCGNSPMSFQMLPYFSSIVSTDISETLINQMKKRYPDEHLQWEVMDCRKMTFPNNFFDYIFEKGTIDALYCSDSSSNDIIQTLDEISRILKPEGYFISISFGSPESRAFLSSNYKNFSFLQHISVPSPKNESVIHHIYIFQLIK